MSNSKFSGRTAAEAAIRACEQLGTTRSELRYDVVEDVGEGLERRVTIAVQGAPSRTSEPSPSPAPPARPAAFERPAAPVLAGDYDDEEDEPPRRDEVSNEAPASGGRRGGRGRNAGGRREQNGSHRAEGNHRGDGNHRGEGQQRNDNGERGGRSGRRRGRGGSRNEGQAGGAREASQERPRQESQRREGGRRGAGPSIDTLLELREAPPTPAPLPAIAATSARSEQAVSVVQALVQHMDLDAQAALVREDEGETHVHVTGKDEKRAIGQRGEVLLSLQFIANRLLGRAEQENEADQVLVLDAGGHRQRRQAAIEALARALSDRAVAEGKAVRLSPMSAHDRRIFHVALEGNDAVVTQSEGDGPMRNLLIVPSVFVR